MDELLYVLVVAVLAIPVLAIVAIVMAGKANGRARRLEERLRLFEARISLLEAKPEGQAAPEQRAVTELAEPVPVVEPAVSEVPLQEPVVEPEIAPLPAPQPTRGFDERLGARWAVWVGGLALAFGAVFLVKYSIDQGFFGPGMRITLGLLLSVVLLGLGEKFRRGGVAEDVAGLPGEHIPSVLTGAGTIAAFATIYAAHALYGMIGAGTAFVLLGLVGLATLFASALHKPWLAALGLTGAYATPLLIESDAPNVWVLLGYLAVVTGMVLQLAGWRAVTWLAMTAVAASTLWGVFVLGTSLSSMNTVSNSTQLSAYALALGALFAYFLVLRWRLGLAAGLVGAVALSAFAAVLWLWTSFTGLPLVVVLALVAGMLVLAGRSPLHAPLGAVAALLAITGYGLWASDYHMAPELWATHANAPEGYGLIGIVLGGLLAAGGLVLAVLTPARAIGAAIGAAIGVVSPLIMLVLAYRGLTFTPPAPLFASDIFGIIALALAAGFASLSTMLAQLERKHADDLAYPQALGIYAAGSAAALALGLAMLLERGWLAVGFALAALAVAWISTQRPVPYLRGVAAALGVLVAVQLLRDPIIAPLDVGLTPIFNWLIWAYGVPAAAFAAAAFLLRRVRDDMPVRVFEALAILFAAAFAFLEMRHFIHDGDLLVMDFTLAEQGLTTMLALAFALGLQRINRKAQSPVLANASLAAGAFSFLAIAVMHFALLNPMFTGRSIGSGLVFNDLLLGYALPTLMAGLVFWRSAGRPQWYLRAAGGLSLALAFAWLSLQVRAVYHGEFLDRGTTTAAEWYTYSAVWLGFGVALLAGGLLLNVKVLRFASAAVILFAVCKVFLFDMAALEGILRALSFLGLGGVLIGVGYAYQKLLFTAPRVS